MLKPREPGNSERKTCKIFFLTFKMIFVLFVATLSIEFKNKCPTCRKKIYVNTARGAKGKAVAVRCIGVIFFILREAGQTKSQEVQLRLWGWQSEIPSLFMQSLVPPLIRCSQLEMGMERESYIFPGCLNL